MNRYIPLRSTKHLLSTYFNIPFLYGRRSYSQEGEDMYLLKLFDGKKGGFFVDVGAHHPYRYSNTFALYRLGWRGINIDATPGSMKAFDRVRRRDINVELTVGNTNTTTTFYMFEERALNTSSQKVAQAVIDSGQSRLLQKIQVRQKLLAEILDQYLPNNVVFDFLNVDVEGKDVEVLKSNDWKRFRPQVILVEELGIHNVRQAIEATATRFLKDKGYELRDAMGNSLVFVKTN